MIIRASDLKDIEIGEIVSIAGIIEDRKKLRDKKMLILVSDITGRIRVLVDTNQERIAQFGFHKKKRIKTTGIVSLVPNSDEKQISDIVEIVELLDAESNSLDIGIRMKAGLISVSAICRKVSVYLANRGFIEFDSRVISYTWQMDGLEALKVVYPGFGSPVSLTTSPSAQIIDFLKTTFVLRAFTVTASFATTFRFKNGASETKVIMAKGQDIGQSELINMLYTIVHDILAEEYSNLPLLSDCLLNVNWNNRKGNYILKNKMNIIVYDAHIANEEKDYSSIINMIVHVIDEEGNILSEGSYETVNERASISTITIYPTQLSSALKKTPSRQLKDLWRKHG